MDRAKFLEELVGSVAGPGGPGVAIGLYADGVLLQHAGAGEASVEFGVGIDENTRFDIASMSKQFTAAAALILSRDGAFALDDDIRVHLPELALSVPVTIAQCLEHIGGLREWLALAAAAGRPLTRISQQQTLDFVAGFASVDFEPGSAFSYSNTGYVLVASLVHRLTGKTLGEFAAERIFAPLGMTATQFREDSRAPLARFAYGYALSDGAVRRADSEECAVGDGGLVTSIADLAPWFGFLQDGRVLGTDIRDGLLERPTTHDGQLQPYARGLYHVTIAGRPAFGHAGGVEGYRSQLFIIPSENLGVAVLANTSAIAPDLLAARALEAALGVAESPATEFVERTEEAEALAGYWEDTATEAALRLELVDGARLRASGAIPDGEFALAGDGVWHGIGSLRPLSLRANSRAIEIASPLRPGRGSTFERCDAPDAASTVPAGAYLSPELGTFATVADDGTLQLGLSLVAPIEAAPNGAFSAAGFTLRVHGDDLLLSDGQVRRLRFERQSDGVGPLGVPTGLAHD